MWKRFFKTNQGTATEDQILCDKVEIAEAAHMPDGFKPLLDSRNRPLAAVYAAKSPDALIAAARSVN